MLTKKDNAHDPVEKDSKNDGKSDNLSEEAQKASLLNSFNSEIGYMNNLKFTTTMGISFRTAQKWRSMKIVPFSKFRGRVFYKVSDINYLLDSYSNKPIYKLKNHSNDEFTF